MIRHVFLWQAAPGASNDTILDMLTQLSKEMDFIVEWSLGAHEGAPNDNGQPWDGALITDFRTWDDLERYSTDPVHAELVDTLLPMVTGRAVVDFEVDA
ncbi:Dabb family protein [Pseudonocardia acidicola]|uniref:Dabb family protein n=1 Tax=Pseudonocardia acidicola TaxID=2724939 RepID=A0ABX1SKG8_9PSEU|nr:Dabb family protein [Pseudonocardia acidicola]NMI00999.1 Dabb family protein [Pseudonocardia acidicola]